MPDIHPANMTEPDAVRALASQLWPYGPECSRCGSCSGAEKLRDAKAWACDACVARFEITDNTPLAGSFIPLNILLRVINTAYHARPKVSDRDLARQARVSVMTLVWIRSLVAKAIDAPEIIDPTRSILLAAGVTEDELASCQQAWHKRQEAKAEADRKRQEVAAERDAKRAKKNTERCRARRQKAKQTAQSARA